MDFPAEEPGTHGFSRGSGEPGRRGQSLGHTHFLEDPQEPGKSITSAQMQSDYSNTNEHTLAGIPPAGGEIIVNVDHGQFRDSGMLSWGIGHESGHLELGLIDEIFNNQPAYYHGNEVQRSAFDELPAAQRLNNPDHLMRFSE